MQGFKVFSAGVMHESHSFSELRADLDRFRTTDGYHRDDEVLTAYRGTNSEMGAVIDQAERHGWDLVHPLMANTTPSGPVTREAYEHFSDVILTALRAALPVDGLLMPLHGAMVTDGLEDAEGELVRRLRDVVGPDVPIAVTLDLHANVGPDLAHYADIISGYRTTPHVDMYETARRVGELLQRAMLREIRPRIAYAQPAAFESLDMGRTISGAGPMVDILAQARALEGKDDILDISIQAGFDWSDKKHLGPSVLVTSDGETPRAQEIADELAAFAWRTRGVKTIALLPIDEAMRIAQEPGGGPGPLLIGDFTDCPGAAAMGDGTLLLKAMIEADLEDAALCSIADPYAVQQAVAAGVGATVRLSLGGKLNPKFGGGPLDCDAMVLRLSDGVAVRKGPYYTGVATTFGPSCLLEIGGVRVIVATNRLQIDDREQFRIFGVDPDTTNIVACKAVNHFRADFEPIGRRLIYVEAGGLASCNFKQFDYRRVRRPVWPLDDV